MVTPASSSASTEPRSLDDRPAGWLKLGAVAAASVFAGGLIAVWWHRNTVKKLRLAAETDENPHFGISDADPDEEI